MSEEDRFLQEAEQIDEQERQRKKLLYGDSAEFGAPDGPLSLGPDLEPKFGKDMTKFQIRSQLIKKATTPVTLHVYAVGHAESVAKINKVAQDILGEGGIFHGAIEVHGKEWSFGGTDDDGPGVFCCEPGRCTMHTYRESVYLGDCNKDNQQVHEILKRMLPEWKGSSYDLLHKNCCSFSNAFAMELGVGKIPEWVHHLAHLGSAIDDDTKLAISALHKVEDTIINDVAVAMDTLSGDRRGGKASQQRHCRCCWFGEM